MKRLLGILLAIGCGGGGASVDGGARDASSLDARTDATSSVDAAREEDAPSDGGDDASVVTADVHYVGRFAFSDGSARFAWPGSEIVTRFAGTSVSVDLESGGTGYFVAWVDGEREAPLRVESGRRTYVIAEGLADTEHTVRLVRRNETFVGNATTFHGFVGITSIPSPAPYGRLVEFVGDSITCGYGNLGDGPGCPFSAETESEPDAYGAITAARLGAGHVAVAWSGIGLTQNYGGSTEGLMGERYARTIGTEDTAWSFEDAPDVVVVLLGTNDFWNGDPGTAFADAMDTFVQQVRTRRPDATIVLATSPMIGGENHARHRGYLQTAIDRAASRGDARVFLAEVPTGTNTGCDYHPSVAGHEAVADVVTARIREVMGW
ncbi:MAG: SGNH/GDSL hydrolase family protein [Polyangiales bacterium]